MNKKEIATSFLRNASSGEVRKAYEQFIHPQFRHHNAYFKGDRESFLKAMEENAQQFPDKTYTR
jgi:predicted SnoaL-like aldol condensation-catalyzing enzyme